MKCSSSLYIFGYITLNLFLAFPTYIKWHQFIWWLLLLYVHTMIICQKLRRKDPATTKNMYPWSVSSWIDTILLRYKYFQYKCYQPTDLGVSNMHIVRCKWSHLGPVEITDKTYSLYSLTVGHKQQEHSK